MNTKKYINFILWIALVISCNALGLITSVISDTNITDNLNKSGIMIDTKYQSDLNIGTETITTYRYMEQAGDSSYNLDQQAKMLFALIPRTIECTESPGFNTSVDKILRMNIYLNKYGIIEKKLVDTLKLYLSANRLENSVNPETKEILIKAIQGSHGLFMPKNMEQMQKFNGISRTLAAPVTTINKLLLTTADFNSTNINQEQITLLQKQIFQVAAHAKTVIFIPECISLQASEKLRLPIAIINKVILNSENNTITINLLFHQNTKDNFLGFYDFITARNALITETHITDQQWEFIDYTFKIRANNTQQNYYSFNNAKIEQEGNIQTKDMMCHTRLHYDIRDIALLHESRQITYLYGINSPCSHYERKCLVKFSCCDEYFPCHRCHNNKHQNLEAIDTNHPKYLCVNPKKKAKDTIMLKCLKCNHEQHFDSETGQYCLNCNLKFADYYCRICKNLTENNCNYQHCNKCDICRAYPNKLGYFHCDTCKVCLDISLKDNHLCRNNDGHEICGICLEDTFNGAKILPCSHRIHMICFEEMRKNRVTTCPVCRENICTTANTRYLWYR